MRIISQKHIGAALLATAMLAVAVSAGSPLVAPPYFEHAPGTRDKSLRLLRAVSAAELAVVRDCIALGADVNVWTADGLTPVRGAVGNRDLSMLRILIEAGAVLDNQPYGAPESALFDAVREGFVEAVRLLIEHGVDVRGRDRYRRTPMHYANGPDAVKVIRMLVNEGADVSARDREGMTPLETMLNSNIDSDVVNVLLDMGSPTPRYPVGAFGMGPLDVALLNGRADLARLLVGLGANQSSEIVSIGLPFYIAVLESDDNTAIEEVATEVANKRNGNGFLTPLHLASMRGRTRVIQALVESGEPLDQRDWVGRTPLGVAAHYGQLDAAKLLLKLGADPNDGRVPPLVGAVNKGCVDVVSILLDAGARVDGAGSSLADGGLLHHASSRGDAPVVRLLLSCGARPDSIDDTRNTPLHDVGHSEEVWSLLINAGADPCFPNKYGETPLLRQFGSENDSIALKLIAGSLSPALDTPMLEAGLQAAVASGSERVVSGLLDLGVDPNACGHAIAKTLRFLTNEQEARYAELLVRNGADVRADGAFGVLLRAACLNGHGDLVKVLLDNGADPSSPDKDGVTPIEHALKGGHAKIASLLRARLATVPCQLGPEVLDFLIAVVGEQDDMAIRCVPSVDMEARLLRDECALDVAIRAQRPAVVRALVRAGAGVDTKMGLLERPPLHAAIDAGSLEMVGILLEAGADPNAQGRYIAPPLHRAVQLRSVTLARLLLKAGADSKQRDYRGRTALDMAREQMLVELAQLIESP